MKVLLHCYSGYTYFLREIINLTRKLRTDVDWEIILYSNAENLLNEFKDLVGDENTLYLQEKLNNYMRNAEINLDELKSFPVSIYQCISTSKVEIGVIPLQKMSRKYQLKIVTGTYTIYKEFLLKHRPDFVFFPIVDLYDSMILYHLCKELNITPIICTHARNLGVSYFSDSIYETLPPYTFKETISHETVKKAEDFIHSFRKNFKPAFEIHYEPTPDEIIYTHFLKKNIFAKTFKVIMRRLTGFEPHLVDKYTLTRKLMIHFFPITMRYRKLKGALYKFFYDLHVVDKLPQKFIYYPLQVTPESSINNPAPFFVDQLRAVDLILNSMPPDFYLVVKEHPAMKGRRPISFYRALKERAGILLADFSLPSIDVIKKASLTISVTGTACLEAFLLGKPSLHLGRVFFTDWIYKFDNFSDFKKVLKEAIDSREVPMEKIVDLVSKVFSVGDDFILYSPNDPYTNTDQLMNKRNINKFLEGLLAHIQQLKTCTSH